MVTTLLRVLVACALLVLARGATEPEVVLQKFYRYWNGRDHFYTTNAAEIGTTTPGRVGRHGYRSEGYMGYLASKSDSGALPLFRYWNGRDHFYTTNINEIGTSRPGQRGRHGYTSEGTAGFCQKRRTAESMPLYRYWNGRDHFYTTNIREIGTATPGRRGRHGYTSEGVACYVYKGDGIAADVDADVDAEVEGEPDVADTVVDWDWGVDQDDDEGAFADEYGYEFAAMEDDDEESAGYGAQAAGAGAVALLALAGWQVYRRRRAGQDADGYVTPADAPSGEAQTLL